MEGSIGNKDMWLTEMMLDVTFVVNTIRPLYY